MQKKNENFFSGFVILSALVVGGLIGWFGGSYLSPAMPYNNQRSESGFVSGVGGGPEVSQAVVPYATNISDFRVQLNSILKEHGVISSEYLQNLYDGREAGNFKKLLDQNTLLLSNLIGKTYGNNEKSEFLNIWNDHIRAYEKYTHAVKRKDSSSKQEAKDELHALTNKMSILMQSFDRNISQERLNTLMSEHVRLTLEIIDAYAAKDNEILAASKKKAFDQAGELADFLGQAIVSSHPNMLR